MCAELGVGVCVCVYVRRAQRVKLSIDSLKIFGRGQPERSRRKFRDAFNSYKLSTYCSFEWGESFPLLASPLLLGPWLLETEWVRGCVERGILSLLYRIIFPLEHTVHYLRIEVLIR